MQLEVGSIIEGKITGITKFGAFVELPTGKTGMVHISEVSSSYVKEISDHLEENQVVKVKVLSVTPDGKVSLSIKKCLESSDTPSTGSAPTGHTGHTGHNGHAASGGGRSGATQSSAPFQRPAQPRRHSPRDLGWRGPKQSHGGELTFEDMLVKFKQTSDDKMSDLKKSTETRRSSPKKPSPR